MSTKYLIERDVSGISNGTGFGIPFAADGETAVLAQNVEQHITVPSNYPDWLVVINVSNDATVWVDVFGTVAIPSGSFGASTSVIVPSIGMGRYVKKGQTLSFKTSDMAGATVSVSFYPTGFYQN